jgi:hypothetical protein
MDIRQPKRPAARDSDKRSVGQYWTEPLGDLCLREHQELRTASCHFGKLLCQVGQSAAGLRRGRIDGHPQDARLQLAGSTHRTPQGAALPLEVRGLR